MKNSQQGFIGLPVLIAIVLGLAVLGGGAGYFVLTQKSSAPSTTSENELPVAQKSTDIQTSGNQSPQAVTINLTTNGVTNSSAKVGDTLHTVWNSKNADEVTRTVSYTGCLNSLTNQVVATMVTDVNGSYYSDISGEELGCTITLTAIAKNTTIGQQATATNVITVTSGSAGTSSRSPVIGTYEVGNALSGITFDPYTKSIWVTNVTYRPNIRKLNASTGAVIGAYTVDHTIFDSTFDPYTNSIWIVDGERNATKLNVSTGETVGTYTAGKDPYGITFDPSTNSIWTANTMFGEVTKLSASTGKVVGTYDVKNDGGIVFNASDNSIWVRDDDTITKLSASTGTVIDTYKVGAMTSKIVFDSSTKSMWVANGNSDKVMKLDALTGAVTGTYSVGDNPVAIAFDPVTKSIWVANANSKDVSKLNASTGAVIGTYGVGKKPIAITFDTSTNSIWVADGSSGKVAKLDIFAK